MGKREVEILDFDDLDNPKIITEEIKDDSLNNKEELLLNNDFEELSFDQKEVDQIMEEQQDKKELREKEENKQEIKDDKDIIKDVLASKKTKRVLKKIRYEIVILLALVLILAFVVFQYITGFDIFGVYNKKTIKKVTTQKISSEYTMSMNGKNLTFYDDNTFKYINDKIKITGKYEENETTINLIGDNKTCTLIKKNNMLLTDCDLIQGNNIKVLYKTSSKDYANLKELALNFINSLPVLSKMPELKSSSVDTISNCFTDASNVNLVCQVGYTIEPNEKDLTKSRWLDNGKIEGSKIIKIGYITYKITNNNYEFVKYASTL